jgi:hypothetical protein
VREALFSLVIALLLVAGRSSAEEADPYARAQRADAELRFEDALRDYEEGLARAPSSRYAPLARARAAELRAHAEGDFAPLARLERVRRSAKLGSDPAEIDALVRDAEAFPPGPVRVEAWVLAAEAYAHRLGRPGDALPLYRRVAADPAAGPVLAQKAARDLALALLGARDFEGAREAARLATPDVQRLVARVERRRWLHFASIGALASLVLLAARAAVGRLDRARDALRDISPLALGYAAYVAIVGAVLASGYEAGSGTPFLAFGAALAPVLLVARAWGATGSADRGARIARAALAASGAVGAAFLVLEAIDVGYLEGLGL